MAARRSDPAIDCPYVFEIAFARRLLISLNIPSAETIDDGDCWEATRLVALNVERRGGQYFAENSTFNICGYGPTAQGAVENAVEHLAHYFQRYKSLADDQLTEGALKIKHQYLELFTEE